jgi:hypothetical protein
MCNIDTELPAGFQDADFDMRSLESAGRHAQAMRRKGLCPHSWVMAPDVGEAKCLDCGKVFQNAAALWAEHDRIMDRR